MRALTPALVSLLPLGLAVVGVSPIRAQTAEGPGAVLYDSLEIANLRGEIEGRDWIRVEIPRGLLDVEAPDAIIPREWVSLAEARLEGTSIQYADLRLPRRIAPGHARLPQPLPLSQVFGVQVKRRSTRFGLITGGVVGGGLMFSRGMAGACPKKPTCYRAEEIALATAGGLVVGALVGGLVGTWIVTWHPVVEKSTPRRRPRNPILH